MAQKAENDWNPGTWGTELRVLCGSYLTNEYQYDRVWTKVAIALEGLNLIDKWCSHIY